MGLARDAPIARAGMIGEKGTADDPAIF